MADDNSEGYVGGILNMTGCKADRDVPPEVRIWYFSNPGNKAIDGRLAPYHAIQFAAPHAGSNDLPKRAKASRFGGCHWLRFVLAGYAPPSAPD